MKYVRAGLVPYAEAWEMQRALHARRVAGEIGDTCLLLEHPSVYTAGKRTEPWERKAVEAIDVDRGGKITWHGPGQLVGYPIVSLEPAVDVVAYVRRIEDALIAACAEFGVETDRVAGRSGVWAGGGAATAADGVRGPRPAEEAGVGASAGTLSKVGAIGIRVARGVTMHGFALNCDPDLTAFDAIVPCGIADAGVTSLSVLTGTRITVDDALPVVERALSALAGAPA